MALGRKSNPGFPHCPQPGLEGTYNGEEDSSLLPECENTSANRCSSVGYLGVTWGLPRRSYKPPPQGMNRKGCHTQSGERSMRAVCVTYVHFEPLHSSLMQLWNELQQRMQDRWLRDTNTHTRWAQRFLSIGHKDGFLFVFVFTHHPCSRQKRTRKMWPKTVLCEHFKELWRITKRWNKSSSFMLGPWSFYWRCSFPRAWAPSAAANKENTHLHLWEAKSCLSVSRLTQNDLGHMKPTLWESVFHHEHFYLEDYPVHTSSNLLYKIYISFKLNMWNRTTGDTKKWQCVIASEKCD